MLLDHHRKEWVEQSAVSTKITELNVISLTDHREIDKRLNRNAKARWKHTDWGQGGFWVSGVDPKTGEPRGIGGQFKPDKPIDDRKYIGISESAASPLFLDTGDRQYWQKVLNSNEQILITEGAKKAGAALSAGLAAISCPAWMSCAAASAYAALRLYLPAAAAALPWLIEPAALIAAEPTARTVKVTGSAI